MEGETGRPKVEGADVGADVALVLLDALDVVAMATLLKESKDPMISKVDTVNFMVRRC